MTKKYTPALLLIAFFVLVAFLTMLYGFAHASPFSEEKEQVEQGKSSYSLPTVVPSVWLGNH